MYHFGQCTIPGHVFLPCSLVPPFIILSCLPLLRFVFHFLASVLLVFFYRSQSPVLMLKNGSYYNFFLLSALVSSFFSFFIVTVWCFLFFSQFPALYHCHSTYSRSTQQLCFLLPFFNNSFFLVFHVYHLFFSCAECRFPIIPFIPTPFTPPSARPNENRIEDSIFNLCSRICLFIGYV